MLRQNREHGTTVILTTHDMQDIEALTDRILLIGKGRLLLDGRLDELKSQYLTTQTLTVSYAGAIGPLPAGVTVVESRPGHTVLAVDTPVLPVGAAIAALTQQVTLTDLSVSAPTADELVLRLYESYRI